MSVIEVKVPDIGDFKEVEVIEVLVKVGDVIAAEQSLITVESDKASMEIPSSAAGVVKELRIKLGDKVSEGSVLLLVEAQGAGQGAVAPAPAPAAVSAPVPATASVNPPATPAPAASQAPTAAPGPAAGPVTVEVPDIGDFKEVEVIEVLVKVGDRVAVEQSLITVESDKASMEIPSAAAGVVKAIQVKVGDKVSQGTPVLVLEGGGGPVASGGAAAGAAAAAQPAASAPSSAGASPAPTGAPQIPAELAHPTSTAPLDTRNNEHIVKPHASPSVRLLARELGVDLSRVRGSGEKQRILHEDVKAWVKAALAAAPAAAATPAAGGGDGAALGLLPWPKVDFAKFGPIETKPLSRIKKISAANLHRNWVMIPHVTNHDDADITDLEALRVKLNQENAKGGVKLTMLAFLIKACVACLKKFPEFNASLDGDQLVFKQYWHIGFAADTPNGLVVPVIKDADKKGILQIAEESSALAAKARDGKLSPADMQGGTFSISSLGGIGGTYFSPIINAPEVAILGVCRSAQRPVWNEDKEKFVPRLILPLSLSYDHRVIDGAAAARFNTHLAQLLADFRRVML